MTLTWLFAAAGLALMGTGSPASEQQRRRRSLSPAARLRLLASIVAVACVAALGWERGALAAAVAVPIAAAVLRRAAAAPVRTRLGPDLALTLDLVAVTLRAGQPLHRALALAAPADDAGCGVALSRVGGLLRLGADPAEAWAVVADDPVLAPVAAAGVRSAASGVRLAAEFEQLAVDVRSRLQTAAHSRAARAGVLIAAPLGLCFLPSFVCLGIVPTVIGIAGSVLTG
jgi:Flp pilus assembly protein TadB